MSYGSRRSGYAGAVLADQKRDGEFVAMRGRRTVMLTQPFGGNVTLLPTPLIRASKLQPRQWLVTMMAPTIGAGSTPYAATFDGDAYPPAGGDIYTAPLLPDIPAALQVAVQWGAGGVRYETKFDYPALGGTFSVTADAMDVFATVKNPQAIVYVAANVPVIGAFFVEGAPVDDTPMAWAEEGINVLAAGAPAWSVKPFAKELLLIAEPAITDLRVQWLNTLGTVLSQLDFAAVAGNSYNLRLDVPRQATVVRVTNRGAVAGGVWLEWGIGLS